MAGRKLLCDAFLAKSSKAWPLVRLRPDICKLPGRLAGTSEDAALEHGSLVGEDDPLAADADVQGKCFSSSAPPATRLPSGTCMMQRLPNNTLRMLQGFWLAHAAL